MVKLSPIWKQASIEKYFPGKQASFVHKLVSEVLWEAADTEHHMLQGGLTVARHPGDQEPARKVCVIGRRCFVLGLGGTCMHLGRLWLLHQPEPPDTEAPSGPDQSCDCRQGKLRPQDRRRTVQVRAGEGEGTDPPVLHSKSTAVLPSPKTGKVLLVRATPLEGPCTPGPPHYNRWLLLSSQLKYVLGTCLGLVRRHQNKHMLSPAIDRKPERKTRRKSENSEVAGRPQQSSRLSEHGTLVSEPESHTTM